MKIRGLLLKGVCFALPILFQTGAHALIVYGESNADAAVSYGDAAATSAEKSVVALPGGSAVYLGGGWFITADHVATSAGSTKVTHNGSSVTIDYVDGYLNGYYGADLKLFYSADCASLTSLTSANLSAAAFEAITQTAYGYTGSGQEAVLAYEKGTSVMLVGAGFGRGTADLQAESVARNSSSGTVRSGTSSILYLLEQDGLDYICTLAETQTGSAQGVSRDSGGGMFVEVDGEWCLAAIMTNASSASTATFSSFGDAEFIYDKNGNPVDIDISGLLNTSATFGLVLDDYLDYILATIATNPLIPEPAEYAAMFGLLAAGFVFLRRRK